MTGWRISASQNSVPHVIPGEETWFINDTNVCRELDSSQMNEVTVTATELKQRGF